MKIALEEEGYFINHKKVYRLMSELNIQSIIRKKRRFLKGNYSNTFPNVLNREFKDRQQNKALITGVTTYDFKRASAIFLLYKIFIITKLFLGKFPSVMIMNLY